MGTDLRRKAERKEVRVRVRVGAGYTEDTNHDLAERVFGRFTFLDNLALLPGVALLVLLTLIINYRGNHLPKAAQLESALGHSQPEWTPRRASGPSWRVQPNQTARREATEVQAWDEFIHWSDQVLLPQLLDKREPGAVEPLPGYSTAAQRLFDKLLPGGAAAGAVNLARVPAVRVGPLAVRQLRRASSTSDDEDEDSFVYYDGSALVSSTFVSESGARAVLHSTEGLFGSYGAGGFFAPDASCASGTDCPAVNSWRLGVENYRPLLRTEAADCPANQTAECSQGWLNETLTQAVLVDVLLADPYDGDEYAMLYHCSALLENPIAGRCAELAS